MPPYFLLYFKVMKAKLTSKAQITIPKAIRKQLNLQPGDLLSFDQEQPGRWIFSKVTPENTALGIANSFRSTQNVSVEAMSEAVQARIARQHENCK